MIGKKTKPILVVVLLAGILGAGYYFLLYKGKKDVNNVADNKFGWKFPEESVIPKNADTPFVNSPSALFDVSISPGSEIAYSDIRDPGGIPEGLPVRLKIPVIGVDTAIEDALITPDGRMDVPAGSVNVAWFALGPHPGDKGSAVIGGHFGIRNGVKFVFYDLDKLQVGDKIYIDNDRGDTLAFQVQSIKLFNRDADATDVFTSKDGLAHLNLITCEGIWNRVNDTYPERRVVFTSAIKGEGSVTVKPKFPSTSMQKSTTTPAYIAFLRSLYATPFHGFITSLLLLAIFFFAFKIIRR